MRDKPRDRRFAEMMIGLVLVIAGLSAGDLAATAVLVLLGIYLLTRQFATGWTAGTPRWWTR